MSTFGPASDQTWQLTQEQCECYAASIMTARTMLYLEAGQLEALKERARAERIPVTELIRRLVRQYLGQPVHGTAPPDAWARLVGLGASGRSDVSDNHDRALGVALTREHLR